MSAFSDEWTLELSLTSRRGECYRKCIDLDQKAIFSGMTPRLREEISLYAEVGASPIGIDVMVDLMKKREFRRDLLEAAARQLAGQMADFMQDIEGWHGVERAEKTIRAMKDV